MTGDDLTPEQLKTLLDSVGPMLSFLGRLERRMEKTRFKNDDPIYVAVRRAHDAIHTLNVRLHYLSVGVREPCARPAENVVTPKNNHGEPP